jgi:hypothetical protein
MLVALLLGCADGEVELRTTQNIDYGKKVLPIVGATSSSRHTTVSSNASFRLVA